MGSREIEIERSLNAVIDAMKARGFWDIEAPPESAFENMGAFGLNTMAYAQWLRFVFVPNVQALIAEGGPWPTSSSVAAQAVREFDGDYESEGLIRALGEFDALF
jgi:uncharacterized protein YqcC (DUF446 family)